MEMRAKELGALGFQVYYMHTQTYTHVHSKYTEQKLHMYVYITVVMTLNNEIISFALGE